MITIFGSSLGTRAFLRPRWTTERRLRRAPPVPASGYPAPEGGGVEPRGPSPAVPRVGNESGFADLHTSPSPRTLRNRLPRIKYLHCPLLTPPHFSRRATCSEKQNGTTS